MHWNLFRWNFLRSVPVAGKYFPRRVFARVGRCALAVWLAASIPLAAEDTRPGPKLLFLGDQGPHQPARRFGELEPAMRERGITLTYTDRVSDLEESKLAEYDGLILYANIDRIESSQARALLDYVASGHGFVPLHCASFCFRNSDEVVALIGAQFQRHGTGTFRVTPSDSAASHPLMQGYGGFESWDETYVHTLHNERNRTVLEYRLEGEHREPWTWVRTHGKGRVFYTAWGHDGRTWRNPGFQNLVERGIRWAVGADPSVVPAYADRPEMTAKRTDVKPFEYVDAKLPFYPPGKQWGTTADPISKMQKPLPAEESRKHFVTPVGFAVQLYASEPDIGKPLAMNFDERGRVWLCETIDYPNELQPNGQGHDRIRICEDTNGDGRADKFTVFAEQLSIPAAIAFYRGGAIVQDGTRTLYLKDTDGDDRADLRKVLISNWSLGDTHGGVSNFQYGLDNWFYAMQGYNPSEPELTDGRRVTGFRQGFFRFKVEGSGEQASVTDLEFLRSTNNNTWGLGLSEEGLIFGSTANGNPSEYMPIANRYYERVRGWSPSVLTGIAESNRFEPITENVRQVDHHGGFTAAAGHALYTARSWPREYWNRAAFVTEPTGHLIATFLLTPQGSGFRSRNAWNILASDDEWSAPIMAEVGPDGQLWVIDWYNMIVQHNPTPVGYKTGRGNAYEIDFRDKQHGRIYRVVHGDAPAALPLRLDAEDPRTLIAGLSSDNFFWRRHAQRLLVERGRTAGDEPLVRSLTALVQRDAQDAIGMNPGANHAIWVLAGLGVLATDGESGEAESSAREARHAVEAALRHVSPGVRRNAALALPRDVATVKAILAAQLLQDRDAAARIAALLALSEVPRSADAAEAIAEFAAKSGAAIASDPWLADATVAAAARHDVDFLQVTLTAPETTGWNAAVLGIVTIVAEHLARSAPDANQVERLVGSMSAARPTVVEAIVAGMAKGWPKEKPVGLKQDTESQLLALMQRLSPSARGGLARLAARWGSQALAAHTAQIAADFLAVAADERQSERDRIQAARQLMEFRRDDRPTAEAVAKLITPRTPPEVAAGLVDAIGLGESPDTGVMLVEQLSAWTPAVRSAALKVLLQRVDGTRALLEGMEAGKLEVSELTLDQKQALASHPDRGLARRAGRLLSRSGGLPDPDRQKVIDQISASVIRPANAVKGKEVFKQQCAKCHRHSGEGEHIGPDLTGMAVHPKIELLNHLLDPSRSVEGNFRVFTVTTIDGRILTGLLASENKTAIELVDADAKRHAIQREDIEELIASKKSLMPDGFEKQVPAEAIADLLEFLTQRGKYLPLSLEKAATVVTTKGMFYSEEATAERLIFSDWKPKTFEGVPFVLADPRGDRTPNAVMLNGPQGSIPPRMPRSVSLACNAPAKAIHLLSGVSGWGFPAEPKGSVSMIVRLVYADGQREDHPLFNGEHFADYIRRVDVPGSKFAYALRGQQIRYLAVFPKRQEAILQIDLMKGTDRTAPVVMAVTVESP